MTVFEKWLPKLLTPKELKVIKKRFQIIDLLRAKLTYREIAQQMGISTTTVVRLNQRLGIRKRKRIKPVVNQTLREKNKIPWKIG